MSAKLTGATCFALSTALSFILCTASDCSTWLWRDCLGMQLRALSPRRRRTGSMARHRSPTYRPLSPSVQSYSVCCGQNSQVRG